MTAASVGWYGPLQILLARQAEAISPSGKENLLGLVAGLGAAFSMVANPLWGALSDRTTSRLGKRIPWVAAGGVLGAAGLSLLGSASSVLLLIVGWRLISDKDPRRQPVDSGGPDPNQIAVTAQPVSIAESPTRAGS